MLQVHKREKSFFKGWDMAKNSAFVYDIEIGYIDDLVFSVVIMSDTNMTSKYILQLLKVKKMEVY